MVIGFVGFGEANSSIAQGMREEGLSEIICFDAMQAAVSYTHLDVYKRQDGMRICSSFSLLAI